VANRQRAKRSHQSCRSRQSRRQPSPATRRAFSRSCPTTWTPSTRLRKTRNRPVPRRISWNRSCHMNHAKRSPAVDLRHRANHRVGAAVPPASQPHRHPPLANKAAAAAAPPANRTITTRMVAAPAVATAEETEAAVRADEISHHPKNRRNHLRRRTTTRILYKSRSRSRRVAEEEVVAAVAATIVVRVLLGEDFLRLRNYRCWKNAVRIRPTNRTD